MKSFFLIFISSLLAVFVVFIAVKLAGSKTPESWNHYINETFLYTVDYPPRWKVVPVSQNTMGFRPPWMNKNTVQWAVIVVDEDKFTLDYLIDDMGKGFPETRSVTKQTFEFLSIPVHHVIVTATEKPDWRHEQIFINRKGKIFIVTNGAIPDDDFELFWRSLKFLAPPPPEPAPVASS